MVIMSLYYNPKMTSIEQKDYLLEKKKKKRRDEEMKRKSNLYGMTFFWKWKRIKKHIDILKSNMIKMSEEQNEMIHNDIKYQEFEWVNERLWKMFW